MGNSHGNKVYSSEAPSSNDNQHQLSTGAPISLAIKVAHFTPSTFPLAPDISTMAADRITESWKLLTEKDISDGCGNKTSGTTVFCNEFYERLSTVDASGHLEARLTQNIEGTNKMQARVSILVRIIKFVIDIGGKDSPHVQKTLENLGKLHSLKGIKPWQYSVFLQVLLQTIAARLSEAATSAVMEAWVNILAFVLKGMLPAAITNQQFSVKEFSVDANSIKLNHTLIAAEQEKHISDLRRTMGSRNTMSSLTSLGSNNSPRSMSKASIIANK